MSFTYAPGESYSYIGRDAKNVPLSQPTLNLGWFQSVDYPDENEWKGTTLHEFGHALGFWHEHQHPNI